MNNTETATDGIKSFTFPQFPQDRTCPSCGYCPACGRGGQHFPGYPVWPYYPNFYPQWINEGSDPIPATWKVWTTPFTTPVQSSAGLPDAPSRVEYVFS